MPPVEELGDPDDGQVSTQVVDTDDEDDLDASYSAPVVSAPVVTPPAPVVTPAVVSPPAPPVSEPAVTEEAVEVKPKVKKMVRKPTKTDA